MTQDEDFVPYQESIILKELGFDFKEYATYGERNGKIMRCTKGGLCGARYSIICKAPLYQQVFKWFRKEHNLHSHVKKDPWGPWYNFAILLTNEWSDEDEDFDDYYPSHEEAELACLKKLIEIVKQK